MMKLQSGFTVIEMMISLAILSIATVAMMEVFSGGRDFDSLASAESALASDSNSIIREMTDDLVTSGWLIPDGVAYGTYTALDAATNRLPASLTIDRSVVYYPYVSQPGSTNTTNVEGVAAAMPYLRRDQAFTQLNLPDGYLPGAAVDWSTKFTSASGTVTDAVRAAYIGSFYARSQELVFARIAVRNWDTRPDLHKQQAPIEPYAGTRAAWQTADNNVALNVLRPSQWKPDGAAAEGYTLYPEYPNGDVSYGIPLTSGILVQSGADMEIRPQWERIDATVKTNLPVTTVLDLREYMYCVVPSPGRIGLGRLVRAYTMRNAPIMTMGVEPGNSLAASGNRVLVVEKVLSDNVVRVVFDTARTERDITLGVNQIHVRLYLAKRSEAKPEIIVRRTIDTIITMRAKNTGTLIDLDSSLVPALSTFPY